MARLLSGSGGKAGIQLTRPGIPQSPMSCSPRSPVSGQAAASRCNGSANSLRNIKVCDIFLLVSEVCQFIENANGSENI